MRNSVVVVMVVLSMMIFGFSVAQVKAADKSEPAQTEEKKASSDDAIKAALEKTVSDYWKTRIEGKLESLYTMEDPAFREKFKLTDYLKRFGNMTVLQDVNVLGINLNDSKTEATTEIEAKYKYNIPVPEVAGKVGQKKTIDKWVRVGEQWYHVMPPEE